jgi:type II secretory pathway pseudopilin PulG
VCPLSRAGDVALTLLESLIALVIVGLFAVGTLEALQVSSASSRNAADWATAIAYADAAMEEARLASRTTEARTAKAPAGFTAITERMEREDGLQEIVITVAMPGGSRFHLRRLAAR